MISQAILSEKFIQVGNFTHNRFM